MNTYEYTVKYSKIDEGEFKAKAKVYKNGVFREAFKGQTVLDVSTLVNNRYPNARIVAKEPSIATNKLICDETMSGYMQFCTQYGLSAQQAAWVPAVIERIATKQGISQKALLKLTRRDSVLGNAILFSIENLTENG